MASQPPSPPPPPPGSGLGNNGPGIAQVILTGTLMGQAAAIRHVGQAATSGFRPSLPSLLFNLSSFRAAPMPVKVASGALIGTKMVVDSVGGLPSIPQLVQQHAPEYFCKPIETIKNWFQPPPPPPTGTV